MDISSAISSVFNFMWSIVNILRNSARFSAFGYSVSYFDVVITFLFIFMVVSLFWKGARA